MLQHTKSHRQFYAPTYIAESVQDIDFTYLRQRGIKAMFIDLDGTVVARGTHAVSPKISEVLSSQPLPVYIATNRPKSRDLKNLKEVLNAQGVIHPRGMAGKPFPSYFKTACATHGLMPHETVMVGDRFLQDIIGANAAGLATVVVKKLDTPTNWIDRALSRFERWLASRLSRNYEKI